MVPALRMDVRKLDMAFANIPRRWDALVATGLMLRRDEERRWCPRLDDSCEGRCGSLYESCDALLCRCLLWLLWLRRVSWLSRLWWLLVL